jgi:hypothetical protein
MEMGMHRTLSAAVTLAALGVCLASCTIPVDVIPGPGSGSGGTAGGSGGTAGGSGGTAGVPLPGAVTMDPPGATFVGTQRITLRAADGNIHYTLDGSLPTSASPIYREPITVQTPTVLRAFAARDGQPPGPMVGATFLPVAAELGAWSSNLPVVVLHTHGEGTLPAVQDGPFHPGSMLAREPAAGGRGPLVGPASLGTRAGLRVRGASSVMFPQKSYSVELRRADSDDDGDRPLLGLASESDFALVGGAFMDRTLIRNALAYALSNSIGRWAPRTRLVEVFLVESGGPVRAADYRGVYTLVETIKRVGGRLDLATLAAAAADPPEVTGGYIIRIDKGVANFSAGGHQFQYVYPDWDEMALPGRARQRSYLEGQVRELLETLARPDYRHPMTGKHYRDYLDVPSFVDHNLVNALMKNVDALRISAYFHKPLGQPLHAGPIWDFDRSSGTPQDDARYATPRALEPREWAREDATHPLMWGFWARLFADPAFKTAHTQRFAELSRGPFSVATIHGLIDGLAAQLAEAQGRHFARWPDMPPAAGSHAAEVTALKAWFSARVPWMQSQL